MAKITKISEFIKALEYSKECIQSDDLSEVFGVYVENQQRENGVYVGDPVVFNEDDGDHSIEVRVIATDGFVNVFNNTEKSRSSREWYD